MEEPYLLHAEDGLVVFATERDLESLLDSDTIYVDGTFQSAPKPFKHYVTVYCKLTIFYNYPHFGPILVIIAFFFNSFWHKYTP